MSWTKYISAPLRAAGKVKRNWPLVRSFARLALTKEDKVRERSLAEIAEWIFEKKSPEEMLNWIFQERLEADCKTALGSAKGFAKDLVGQPEFRDHLVATPHLGALTSLSPIKATRLHYVALCLEAVLDIKKNCPGIGLGSKTLKVGYRDELLTTAELAQTILVIQNAGHLFGTFATERGLLYHLDDTPGAAPKFVALIDEGLRDWTREILNSSSLYRFYYALAAYRVSRLSDHDLKHTLIAALRLLKTSPGGAHDPLSWTVRRARQIAYSRMHAYLRLAGTFGPGEYRHLSRQLRRRPLLGFDSLDENKNPCSEMLQAIDDYHSLEFFCGAKAGVLVLDHLRRFKRWWRSQNEAGIALGERIDRLAVQPPDWPTGPVGQELELAVRLDLPKGGGNWISEVKAWTGDGSCWSGTNFLLSPSHNDERLVCDVYRVGLGWQPCWLQVGLQLATRNEHTWSGSADERSRDIWRTVAQFGLTLLQDVLVPGVVATMDPTPAADGRVGYGLICKSVEAGCSKIRDFTAKAKDPQRRAELDALWEIRRRAGDRGDCWLAFLGPVLIRDKANGNTLRELDGVWVDLSRDSARWNVIEHKGGKETGRAQLEGLRKHVSVETSAPEEVELEGGGRAWQLQFTHR